MFYICYYIIAQCLILALTLIALWCIGSVSKSFLIMSFSEIVNELQGDKNKGVKMLVSLSEEQKQALEEIKDAERLVEKANQKYNSTMNSIKLVCQHLKVEPHFIIREGKKIYQITPEFQAHISIVDYE